MKEIRYFFSDLDLFEVKNVPLSIQEWINVTIICHVTTNPQMFFVK